MEATLQVNNSTYKVSKVKKAKKLNAKGKRKFMRINSKEMFHLSRKDREKVKEEIRNTHMWVVGVKSNFNCVGVIDLTEDGMEEAFKYFDDPDFPIVELDNNFYFVRPEEQTLPQRQTGTYLMAHLLDMLKGTKKAQATFLVRSDEDYNGQIYCYDGQHQLLLLAEFLLFNRKFMTQDLRDAMKLKIEHFGLKWWDTNCAKGSVWYLIQEFLSTYKEDTFSKKDMTDSIPELDDVFSNPDISSVYGNMHFCDSKTGGLLNEKINENWSSHSTAQRTKSKVVGTTLHKLLFKKDYEITSNIKGKLSKIVPKIPLFNRGDNDLPAGIADGFSYDTSSNDFKFMNYDQYLKLVYSCILSKTKKVEVKDDDGQLLSLSYEFDINTDLNESYINVHGAFKNGLWASHGIIKEVLDFWIEGLSNLIIKDEIQFTQYIESVIKLCFSLSELKNVNSIQKFDKKLDGMLKPVRARKIEITGKYPIDAIPIKYEKELEDLNFKINCIEDFKLKKTFQLLPMMFMILNTRYISKYKIEDWTAGFLQTIVNEFDHTVEKNQKEWIKKKKRTTLSRMRLLNEWYNNNAFSNRVSAEIQNQDTSLWTRIQSMRYIDDKLHHTDDILYKCPHTGKNVTKDNFVSHHLSFKSKGDAYKVFDFWFPLSSKFNGHIGDDKSRNIVKNNVDGSSGNFIDACESMINLFDNKIKNSDGTDKVEWKKSRATMTNWIEYAKLVIN